MPEVRERREDSIDTEFRQLMTAMHEQEQAEEVIRAWQVIFDAEKMPAGVEKRKIVAKALGTIILLMPAARECASHANPDMENFAQLAGCVRVALGLLFDLL